MVLTKEGMKARRVVEARAEYDPADAELGITRAVKLDLSNGGPEGALAITCSLTIEQAEELARALLACVKEARST